MEYLTEINRKNKTMLMTKEKNKTIKMNISKCNEYKAETKSFTTTIVV